MDTVCSAPTVDGALLEEFGEAAQLLPRAHVFGFKKGHPDHVEIQHDMETTMVKLEAFVAAAYLLEVPGWLETFSVIDIINIVGNGGSVWWATLQHAKATCIEPID